MVAFLCSRIPPSTLSTVATSYWALVTRASAHLLKREREMHFYCDPLPWLGTYLACLETHIEILNVAHVT
jgi:hypothetical protein